jgi:hypothetical protein
LIPILLGGMPRRSDKKTNLGELLLRTLLLVIRDRNLNDAIDFFPINLCFASYTNARDKHIADIAVGGSKAPYFTGGVGD